MVFVTFCISEFSNFNVFDNIIDIHKEKKGMLTELRI
jgi:hypothetical protein